MTLTMKLKTSLSLALMQLCLGLPALAADIPISMYPKYILDDTSEHAITVMPDRSIPVLPVLSVPYRRSELTTTATPFEQYVIGSLYDPADQTKLYTFLDSSVIKVNVNGEQLWRVDHDPKVYRTSSFDVSGRGNLVALGHLQGQLALINGATGLVYRIIEQACEGACTATAISSDEVFVAVGSSAGGIHIFNSSTGERMTSWAALNWPVRNIRIFTSPSGTFVVAHDWSTLTIYNLDEATEIKRISNVARDGFTDMWIDTFSMMAGDNRGLVCSNRALKILDLRDGSVVREFSGAADILLAAQVDPGETKITAFSRDHTVFMWDIDDGSLFSKHRIEASSLSTFQNVTIAPTADRLSLTSLELEFSFPPALFNTVKTYAIPQE